jgi:hypothetical protein
VRLLIISLESNSNIAVFAKNLPQDATELKRKHDLTNTRRLTSATSNKMKYPATIVSLTAAMALSFIGAQAVRAQEAVQQTTTTTTNAGTISDFGPQTIVVRSEDAAAPVRYTYTKSTTYVDEDGNPVSMETVRSGLPVTIYYTRSGDDLVASKVVVRKTVIQSTAPAVPVAPVAAPPVIQEQKTTTTTTTTTDH